MSEVPRPYKELRWGGSKQGGRPICPREGPWSDGGTLSTQSWEGYRVYMLEQLQWRPQYLPSPTHR